MTEPVLEISQNEGGDSRHCSYLSTRPKLLGIGHFAARPILVLRTPLSFFFFSCSFLAPSCPAGFFATESHFTEPFYTFSYPPCHRPHPHWSLRACPIREPPLTVFMMSHHSLPVSVYVRKRRFRGQGFQNPWLGFSRRRPGRGRGIFWPPQAWLRSYWSRIGQGKLSFSMHPGFLCVPWPFFPIIAGGN